MQERHNSKTQAGAGAIKLRFNIVYSAFLLGAATLAAHLFFLQFNEDQHNYYSDELRTRWHSYECPQGRRGDILYRDGTLIAGTRKAARVIVEPGLVKDLPQVSQLLSQAVGQPADAIERRISHCKGRALEVAAGLDVVDALEIDKAGLRGIFTRYYYEREYPHGSMGASTTVGYAGRQPSLRIGIEKFCDATLTGVDGKIVYRKDAFRQRLPGSVEEETPAVQGQDVTTTLHLGIQTICEDELLKACKQNRSEWACALVMRPQDGEVLGAATFPNFDPNEYVKGNIGVERNVLVHAAVEPGSTVKPLLVSYALEQGWLEPEQRFRCDKLLDINGHRIKEAELSHVLVDPGGAKLERIISQSSNIGMAQVALQLGQARVQEAYSNMGFFARTGIELPGERKGSAPPDKKWPRITIANTGFGQGFTVTPLQLASAYCVIANGGHRVQASLLLPANCEPIPAEPDRVPSLPEGEELISGVLRLSSGTSHAAETQSAATGPNRRILSPETCKRLTSWLVETVNEGTGSRAQLELYQAAGKTGTAQIAGPKGYGNGYIASFIGYFPAESPRYLVLVMFCRPKSAYYGGLVAAPVFKNIGDRISYMDQLELTRLASREAKDAAR